MQPLWKAVWKFFKNLRIELLYNQVVPSVVIYLKNKKNQFEKIDMFIWALCTIAKIWKYPKCPLKDGWVKKKWYTYTMKYYSAIQRRKPCNNMDGPWKHNAKWNKSEKEK